jgi:hypothetical protein
MTLCNPPQCFGTYDDTQYTDTSLSQEWRLWQFQVCTEWGYFFVRLSFYVSKGDANHHSRPLRLTQTTLE